MFVFFWFVVSKPVHRWHRAHGTITIVTYGHTPTVPADPASVGLWFGDYSTHTTTIQAPSASCLWPPGLATMEPIYSPRNVEPAYQLNWGLTIFWRERPIPDKEWFTALKAATEPDGVRVLKHRITTNNASQFFVSTKPHVSPSQMIRSVKGRLQYHIRSQQPKAFQRNYAVRSIGSATRGVVEEYVAKQLDRHLMADSRVQDQLQQYQKIFPNVDLSRPVTSGHGQYWYNLHLVLVNDHRWMEIRPTILEELSRMIDRVAAKYGHRVSRGGLLADHVHLTMGCGVDQVPEDVALSYLNNLAYAVGMTPYFQFGYYVGTIGEYDRGAVP